MKKQTFKKNTCEEKQPFETDDAFKHWLAGVVDGDGNFDFRRQTLKSIRIKIGVRDVRILKRIQNKLHCGRIRSVENGRYVLYIVSTREHMTRFVRLINGHIRVKVPKFEKACVALGLTYIKAPAVPPYSAYLAGLVDSDGSVVLNPDQNCITVGVEVNMSPSVQDLDLDAVIPFVKPNKVIRNTASGKKSLRLIYQTVSGMVPVYDYFMVHRLYSDFKFYRVCLTKRFLTLRHFKTCPMGSVEQRIYSTFCLDFLTYQNPQWTTVPLVEKLDKDIVRAYNS